MSALCPKLSAKLAHWRKNGMSRDEVRWRRELWNEKEYQHYRIATAGKAKKRRAAWSEKRLNKAQSETQAREEEKQRKLDALRKAARTGEIE